MRYAFVFASLYLSLLPSAAADDASSAAAAAQLEVMAGGCVTCHGTASRTSGSIPALAGRPADTLANLLLTFKQNAPADTTIMDRIAKGFRDEELVRLAEFFSAIKQK